MKKLGFTLAEVLITLMILGIIAALTIPSLLQNTQNKEQVVQLQKGVSMINQAITMNYALSQDDLNAYADAAGVVAMLRNRMNVTISGDYYVRTQDGLTYYIGTKGTCGSGAPVDKDGAQVAANTCFPIVISTSGDDPDSSYATAAGKVASSTTNVFTHYYQFYAGRNSVVPDRATSTILNAKDASVLTKNDLAAPAGGDEPQTP